MTFALMKNLKIASIFITLLLSLSVPALSKEYAAYKKHNKYDHHFSKYSKRFFGVGFDWQIFKAQAIAESNLREDAKSYVGAQGIMQIMPATYSEIQRKNKFIKGTATDPKWNIAAGIYYDQQLWEFWHADRSFEQRLKFMFASYNAGKGNILKAQKKAQQQGEEANNWFPVSQSLKQVTGKHSKETVNYVEKIFIIQEDIK